jgi:hypothetical protein
MCDDFLVRKLAAVCPSFSDFFHICSYLLIAVVAIIIAIYKFDKKIYITKIFTPIFTFIVTSRFVYYTGLINYLA